MSVQYCCVSMTGKLFNKGSEGKRVYDSQTIQSTEASLKHVLSVSINHVSKVNFPPKLLQ